MDTVKIEDTEYKHSYRKGEALAGIQHLAPSMLFVDNPAERFYEIDEDAALSDEKKLAMKSGLLSSIERLSRTSGSDWVKYYESVNFLKENDWFWKQKGCNSFDEYWHSHTGEGFKVWAELEAMYNFAKVSCPELFTITREEASELFHELKTLREIAPLYTHGGRRKRIFETKEDAILRIKEASITPTKLTAHSLEKRFARIRRDHPEVAARILKGEFLRKTTAGKVFIDMATAERVAYGDEKKLKKRRTRNRLTNIFNVLKNVKDPDQVEQVVDYLRNHESFAPYLKVRVRPHAKTNS